MAAASRRLAKIDEEEEKKTETIGRRQFSRAAAVQKRELWKAN